MIRLIFILLISIYTFQLWGQTKGEWIVQYFNVSNSFHEKSNNEYQLLSSSLSIYLVNDSETLSKSEASELFSEHGKIKHLFRNQEVYPRTYIPDDELYFEQWNMDVINAPNVWEETTGGRSETGEEIVMAVLDDGYDINHIELRNNLWINPNELPGDGIDNDGNGYIDDHQGVNIEDKNDIHPESDHGTQVVGIMAAQGDNNTGIAGMNWNTKVLFVSGVSNVGEIITGYEYVYDLKKRYLESDGTDGANIVVTNLSSGLEFAFPSQLPSWCEIYDLLGSVGVLSVCATANLDVNIEIEGDMPTLCTSDYLIMVTNTDRFDEKVQYAAQNKTHVDLGAPGELITTLDIKNEYSRISGTSASTPHVAGAVALFYTIPCQSLTDLIKINPTAAALTIKNAILNGTAPNVTLDETVSGGRLDVYASLLELSELCGQTNIGELEINKVRSRTSSGTLNPLEIEYTTDNFADHKVMIYDLRGQLVYSNTFNPNVFEEKMISLSDIELANALYVISIISRDKVASKLFLFKH